MEFNHISVLMDETIESLNIKPDGIYVDCTTGGGGHSYEIASKLTTGRLICFDKDTDALAFAKTKLKTAVTTNKSTNDDITIIFFLLDIVFSLFF